MLIGAIADSHDNLSQIEIAIRTLNKQHVDLVLHAGDYISGFVIPKFKQLNCPLIGVFGNNDGDHELLKKRFSETKNCTIHDQFAQVTIGEYKIALIHGEDYNLLNALIESDYFNAVFHGHSHNSSIEQRKKTITINPGELCGYLTGKSTLALLNTDRTEAKIIEL